MWNKKFNVCKKTKLKILQKYVLKAEMKVPQINTRQIEVQ